MKTSKLTGRTFCFQPEELAIADGRDLVLIGERQYRLKTAVRKQDNGWLFPLDDVLRLLAPDIETQVQDGSVAITYEGRAYYKAYRTS